MVDIAGLLSQHTGDPRAVDEHVYGDILELSCSSKAAVNMVMRGAAIDMAPRRIPCVLVNPGWVRTDMGGPKAPLSPQESVTAMRRLVL